MRYQETLLPLGNINVLVCLRDCCSLMGKGNSHMLFQLPKYAEKGTWVIFKLQL